MRYEEGLKYRRVPVVRDTHPETRDEISLDAATDILLETSEPTALVATVYSEPAKEVTTPAPLVANVTASPPAEVTTV